jgi:hypothetical protein
LFFAYYPNTKKEKLKFVLYKLSFLLALGCDKYTIQDLIESKFTQIIIPNDNTDYDIFTRNPFPERPNYTFRSTNKFIGKKHWLNVIERVKSYCVDLSITEQSILNYNISTLHKIVFNLIVESDGFVGHDGLVVEHDGLKTITYILDKLAKIIVAPNVKFGDLILQNNTNELLSESERDEIIKYFDNLQEKLNSDINSMTIGKLFLHIYSGLYTVL